MIGGSGFSGCKSLNEIVFFHQTVIWEWFMGFVNAHHFVELTFLHRLRLSGMLVSKNVQHFVWLSFVQDVEWATMKDFEISRDFLFMKMKMIWKNVGVRFNLGL
jgi:hypothetical protein